MTRRISRALPAINPSGLKWHINFKEAPCVGLSSKKGDVREEDVLSIIVASYRQCWIGNRGVAWSLPSLVLPYPLFRMCLELTSSACFLIALSSDCKAAHISLYMSFTETHLSEIAAHFLY